jgi:L-seryl-tRNA(Ser) seleniumtransferase
MDSKREVKGDPRRALPAVDLLIRQVASRAPDVALWAVREAVRQVLDAARREAGAGGDVPGPAALADRAEQRARTLVLPRPRPLVNATGVVLHTNLGRAPLAPGAAAAALAAAGHTDLELDLASGRRGDRLAGVAEKLALQSGAEAALAVNNNAAAVLLALDTLARGREVIVSRGELVEIGGSFRMPDIVSRAGVRLVEVGTTNRTHVRDYERAIGPETALLMKVHPSNFEQRGFVAEVGLEELSRIGRAHGLPVLDDLGSGTLLDLRERGFPLESDARTRLRQGADLVCLSGDKLLGGPQAGLVLGRADLIAALRSNPLARALRLDKMTLAALDWTLAALLSGRAESEIPVLRQLLVPAARLESRAAALAERLAKVAGDAARVGCEPDRAFVGGGTLPGFSLDTWTVTLSSPGASAQRLAAGLRAARVPVVGRVQGQRVLLDVRTLLEGDEERIEAALVEALQGVAR